jgi:hypothetical protein
VRDGAANIGLLLLKIAESDGTLRTRETVADILSGSNTECNATAYARITGITGTITVDTATHVAKVSVPNQAFVSLGGATNNSLVQAIFYYDQGGTDATRIPLSAHSLGLTTDGTTLTIVIDPTGIFQDAGI